MFPSRLESPHAIAGRCTRRPFARLVFALRLTLLAALTIYTPLARAQSLEPGGPADMGSIAVGGSSINYSFTFSATVPTTISSVVTVEEGSQNQDFVLTPGATQTCTGTITPPHSCNINVTLTPKKIGFRRGAILILDNTGTVVNTQFLYGVGLAPQFSFSPVTSTIISALTGVAPTSFKPSSAVYDGAGNLYFYDYQNGRLLKMDTSSNITSIGSFTGNTHSSLAINGAGTLYLTLPTQGQVEVIKPGVSSTVLTVPGMTLTEPTGIAIDGAGFIYIADAQQNHIVRAAPDSSASSVIPTTGVTLSSPFGLAVNHDFLYIADSGNGRIVDISLATGTAVALTATNALNQPYGISPDPSETLIVADTGGSNIVSVSPTGTVTPLVADTGATLAAVPLGVLVSTSGDVVSSDATLGLVFISRNQGSLTFPTPTKQGSSDATDGYETLTVINSGNQAIQFSSSAPTISDTDYAPGPTNTCPVQQATSTPLAIAATCTYTFGFTPSVIGPDDAVASIRGTSPTTGVAVTGIADLNGTGIAPITTLSVSTNPTSTVPGTPVSFTVSALEGTTPLTTFTGTVTFTLTDPTGVLLGGTSYTFTTADAGTHTFSAAVGAEFNTPGTYTITAKYSTLTGTSNVVTVLYPSATSLSSSVNPVPTAGQTTLTAVVSGTGTAIVPTGSITFFDGTVAVGTCTLSSGRCSYAPTLPVGANESITAVYSGDNNFSPSTSTAFSQTVDGFTSTTTLNSSINPSAIGQATTLTARVVATPGQTNPPTLTGSVTFYDGSTALATVTLTNGVAQYNATFISGGTHSLTVVYSGDTNYATSTSTVLAQVVTSPFTATLSFTSSINPAAPGQSFTLNATVVATPGQTSPPVPMGSVQFFNGTTLFATRTLSGGVVTLTTAFLTRNSYPLTAVYSGDGNYAGSSAMLTEVIAALVASQTALTAAPNPAVVNTSVNLTATIAPATGQTGTPTGKVSFYDGTTLLGMATIVGTTAVFPATFTTVGTHSLTAVYAGDTSFNGSTSPAFVETVTGYTATVGLTSSINPSKPNQSTVLTATVAATAGQTNPPALTGSVIFYDGSTALATVRLTNGVATYSATFITSGTHLLTAVYTGDTNYGTATSTTLSQVVSGLDTTQTSITAAPNPTAIGASVSLSATVLATAGQSNTTQPTGSVSFYDGTTLLGTGSIAGNGVAIYSTAFTTAGTHSLTAVYSGDGSFDSSTSPALAESIAVSVTTVTLTSSINPSVTGQSTMLTASLVATGQNVTPPTASVSFYDGSTLLGTAPVTAGVASLPAAFATPGTHMLTAVYAGDNNFSGATSPILAQVVTSTVLAAATVSLTSGQNPAYTSASVVLTATVAPVASGAVPTGTVTFLTGSSPIGTAALVNGVATLSYAFLPVSTVPITAMYSGDAVYGTATSPILNEVIEDFSFALATPASGSVTVAGGSPATYTFTVAPIGGSVFPAAVNFTLAGYPSNAVYSFSPAALAGGTGPATITLTITPAAVASLERNRMSPQSRYTPFLLAFVVLPLAWPFGKRRRRPVVLLFYLLLLGSALGLTGCLSDPQSGYYGTTPATYPLTVTATSANLSRSASASLTRQ